MIPQRPLIRARRIALGWTQAQLANAIHVSDKTVSKWETGAGLPDSSLAPPLSRALGISPEALLKGSIDSNLPDGGNMKKLRLYQYPVCGNLLTATGPAEISCCGHLLSPMKLQAADEPHRLTITDAEDEKLASWQHPMDKAHHLLFLAVLRDGCVHIVRLYPEDAQEQRLPRIPWARYDCGYSDEKGILFLSKPEKGR